jgi:predicted alpha/beta hydrolase family esterase
MKKPIQILYIHGGEVFENRKEYLTYLESRDIEIEKSKRWYKDIQDKLKNKFEIITPRMPCREMADYESWKINFEKYLKAINRDIILIGTSLGGIFLTKYLSENILNKNIISTYFIAPPFSHEKFESKKLYGDFVLKNNLQKIEENCKNIVFMFSKDDKVVPINDNEIQYKKLLKNSQFFEYDNKNGHFNVSEFPEIIKMLKEDYKNFYK